MTCRSADVLFKDVFAGTLTETVEGGTRFTYAPTWAGGSIACCFPSTRRDHEWSYGLHPFFQHLGPEGWLREQQARSAHIVEEDDLGLLLRYGADCIGAVSIRSKEKDRLTRESTEAPTSPGRTVSGVQKKLLVIRESIKRGRGDLREDRPNDTNGDTHGDISGSIQWGVNKSANAGEFRPALATGPAPYIAKFNSSSIPTLVRNEALSLRWITSILGQNEVNAFVVSSIPLLDEIALVVTRFDRDRTGKKLRLEDCAQILSKPKGQNYAGKYDAAYEDIAAIIVKHSARPAIDLARFYKRLIAFVLVGNCDGHLKNFSLLETPVGLRLSPAYDVVNTAIYPRYDQHLALSIGGRRIHRDQATRALFLDFGQGIGLSPKTMEQILIDLKRQVRKAAPLIRPPDAEDPDGFMTRFEESVRNACFKILGE